jgi:dihydropteroate synthase
MQISNENTAFHPNYSIRLKGLLMDFSTPKVMGIVNLTPDSFFQHSRIKEEAAVLRYVEKMLKDGADLIDVGAFSSRPGAELISEEEEKNRLLDIVAVLIREFPDIILSIDTYRSGVAVAAVQRGASIINDISGGLLDPDMPACMADLKVPYVLMHMLGTPENMQKSPAYKNVSTDVFFFLSKQIAKFRSAGVNDIIVDVGFGFGKTLENNYQLLRELSFFHQLECPLLVGMSRKGMIQQAIHVSAAKALNGTTAAHTLALLNGANILRVHDVKEAKEVIEIVSCYQKK